jgi:DNA-binding CsgD family transcriptional regulator
VLAAVRAHLGEEDFGVHWAVGQAMTLEQVGAYAMSIAGPAKPKPRQPHVAPQAFSGDHRTLTACEREVLQLLVQGLSYAEIAGRLVISPRTVNHHLTTIYGKLGVTSRAAAVHHVLQQGV